MDDRVARAAWRSRDAAAASAFSASSAALAAAASARAAAAALAGVCGRRRGVHSAGGVGARGPPKLADYEIVQVEYRVFRLQSVRCGGATPYRWSE